MEPTKKETLLSELATVIQFYHQFGMDDSVLRAYYMLRKEIRLYNCEARLKDEEQIFVNSNELYRKLKRCNASKLAKWEKEYGEKYGGEEGDT